MVRPPTRLTLVVAVVLVTAGPSALAVADEPTGPPASATDLGTSSPAGPLNETVDDNTTDVTDGNVSDANETDDPADTNGTDNPTDGTDEKLNDTEKTDGELNDTRTTETADETSDNDTSTVESAENATDATDGEESTDAVTETTAGTGDAAERATNVTDEVRTVADETANSTDEVADATGELASATEGGTVTVGVPIRSTSSSGLLEDDIDASVTTNGSDDGGTATGDDSATTGDDQETTAVERDRGETSDANASASATDSGRTPERDRQRGPAGATGAVVGAGALTAAALYPHLADGLALASNAGLLSASSAVAGSRSGTDLRSEFDRFWRFVTPFRYSRWDDSDPLEHETRERLYETVEASPGAYLSEVSDRADVAVSTARHHLDVLEDERLVTTAKLRGKRRYYPGHAEDVQVVAALEDEGTAKVLRALARLGASRGSRLADELDRDASTVSHHLSRLEDAGLVEREREGRAVVNRLAPEVRRVLRGGERSETPATVD